ncbi:MAG: hypothetical protein IJW45_00365 [Oscillospiraceae bacterium]|nr:hypothetical protein [Oscillospiraceae bacterium]
MTKTYWYAVMMDDTDDDWGVGSYDLTEAEEKVAAYKEQGYTDAYIAVIDEGTADDPADPICIDVIR